MPLHVYYQNRSGDVFEVIDSTGAPVHTILGASGSSFEITRPGNFFIEDPATGEIRAVTLGGDSVVGISASQSLSVAPQGVHVDNPVQGMEFVLIAAGFICGAITWRFIMGRW